jgi:hypothetical protein
VEIARGQEKAVELPVPARGAAELTFRSERSFVPQEGRDRRRRAVQLLAVERIAS